MTPPYDLYPEANQRTKKLHVAYRSVLLMLTIAVLICAIAAVREISHTSDRLQRQNEGMIQYLDCVGHLPIPGRTQAQVNACLDVMRRVTRP